MLRKDCKAPTAHRPDQHNRPQFHTHTHTTSAPIHVSMLLLTSRFITSFLAIHETCNALTLYRVFGCHVIITHHTPPRTSFILHPAKHPCPYPYIFSQPLELSTPCIMLPLFSSFYASHPLPPPDQIFTNIRKIIEKLSDFLSDFFARCYCQYFLHCFYRVLD